MFNEDFYPTPKEVIEKMCTGLDLAGKKVLEPSAGSGCIVDYVKTFGAEVMACEKHPDLALIVSRKCRMLKNDFLQVEPQEVSHIDYIIMNPPFSADERHIIHAFDVAPAGCTIIALCNYATIKNPYSENRKKLSQIIEFNGHVTNIGEVFSNADRRTNVEIGLIKLHKQGSGENEFEGYFDMTEEMELQQNGIMQYSEVQNIVSRYVGAVKMWEQVESVSKQINDVINPIDSGLGIAFGAHWTSSNKQYFKLDRDIFKKELQKSAWRSIFQKFNMSRYVTRGVMADINKFVEQQQSVPFTVKNIYKMLEMIVGTHTSRMDKVLVEVFDKICSLSADNSEAGEKWKTNSNYKVNRRFIMNYMTEVGWSGELKLRYSRYEELDDIVKALCFITGMNFDETTRLYRFIDNMNSKADTKLQFGQWYEWGFFKIRGYKKGTMHFEFVDENVWMEFNRRVAKIKGWQLPTKTNSKSKGTERTRRNGVEIYS